jgi:AbrB family looped-hinge helix DNA binding protein
MSTSRSTIQVDGRGRILLPKPLRERLGITPKAMLDVEVGDDGSVVLRDVRDERRRLLHAAQGSFKGRGGSVDDLIAQRRAAAAREVGGK